MRKWGLGKNTADGEEVGEKERWLGDIEGEGDNGKKVELMCEILGLFCISPICISQRAMTVGIHCLCVNIVVKCRVSQWIARA